MVRYILEFKVEELKIIFRKHPILKEIKRFRRQQMSGFGLVSKNAVINIVEKNSKISKFPFKSSFFTYIQKLIRDQKIFEKFIFSDISPSRIF